MREPPNIPEERLRTCLQDQYDLCPITLEFLPRGREYNAGVYRVVSELCNFSYKLLVNDPKTPSQHD